MYLFDTNTIPQITKWFKIVYFFPFGFLECKCCYDGHTSHNLAAHRALYMKIRGDKIGKEN